MSARDSVLLPVFVGVLLGVVILLILSIVFLSPMGGGLLGRWTGRFSSNGEMIYFTGVNDRGERIPFTGGPFWLRMRGGGCASCHGPDGAGDLS